MGQVKKVLDVGNPNTQHLTPLNGKAFRKLFAERYAALALLVDARENPRDLLNRFERADISGCCIEEIVSY